MKSLGVVTLTNKEDQYQRMVASLQHQAEPGILQFLPIHADKNGWNAAVGLNNGIDQAESDWVVCVHQDVVFPDSWLESFRRIVAKVPDNVAVMGLVGYTTKDRYVGHIKDPHGHTHWGALPLPAASLDEHLLMVRKSTGIRFDPDNPGFHLYGTDICLTARANGFDALVVDAPVVHLSGGNRDPSFDRAADWLLAKWGPQYQGFIPTPSMLVGRLRIGNLLRWITVEAYSRFSVQAKRSQCACTQVSCSKTEF